MLREGIYEQIINEQLKSKLKDLDLDKYLIQKESIDVEEAKTVLSKYISEVMKKALKFIREDSSDDRESLLSQINACNELIEIITKLTNENKFQDLKISEDGEILTALFSKINNIRAIRENKVTRPITPISQSSLFTGSSYEPNMLSELKKEILSSDSIDILVSFIRWSGLRCIMDELIEFTQEDNHRLRIITTSYMGATEYKAIEELSKLKNAEIKISYDVDRTRLHAKAYLFKRETGFTTAYIGSSNLSNSALTSGLEWNIKVSEKDSLDIVRKFEATFESYWNDREFVYFDGNEEGDRQKLKRSLNKESHNSSSSEINYFLDINPYHYQKEILDKLKAERILFNKNRNLIVAATGVGKTVIAAFDYKNFVKDNRKEKNRLLFIAHREEILKQSIGTFRAILKDRNFGDLYVGGHVPSSLNHVFVSIQTFNSARLYEKTTADFYDFIIIDEFHRAEAPSYQKLLDYYKPKILLGLTATPERMDGKNVLERFDDRIAAEMRLPEAIDRKLLSPFQYFAVSDEVDLSKLTWTRGGYDVSQLENIYTANDLRVNQIIGSINKYVSDVNEVIGLGFCVSVKHTEYMAERFNRSGLPSIAVHGNTDKLEREDAKRKLVEREIRFIFTVDLYNEGVDIPEINTVLFLRPTESLTVFLQQLGRGLRLSDGKECLTVLDFVGQAHRNYDFEGKFKVLIGQSRHSVEYNIENGFIHLPRGCYIHLEKQAKDYILRNIKSATVNKGNIISKIRTFEADSGLELSLSNFLNYNNYGLADLYGKNGDRSFVRLKVEANIASDFSNKDERELTKRLKNFFHINSIDLIDFILAILKNPDMIYETLSQEQHLMMGMLYYSIYPKFPKNMGYDNYKQALEDFLCNREMVKEVIDILEYNRSRIGFIDKNGDLDFVCPLKIYCSYSRDQILAAFGYYNEERTPPFQAGVKHLEDKNLDAFFITLNKSEKDFSPSTLYDDYAINETLFHWQSQSRTSVESPTGQRYINGRSRIVLFVREYKKQDGYTSPYIYLGEAEYVSHRGSSPISFVWRLKEEMPSGLVKIANKSVV